MNYDSSAKLSILLSHLFVGASKKCLAVANAFCDLENLCSALKNNRSEVAKFLNSADLSSIATAVESNQIEKIIDNLDRHNIFCVTYSSEYYPHTLHDTDDPPMTLFCLGDISLLKTRCLAIVGTRKISTYGKNAATNFTMSLCRFFTIVSGLAVGVDSVAHETTLSEKGKTIAVLGSGLDIMYPPQNRGLFEKIVNNGGLVVSEYPLATEAKSYHFPQRNRIVAGLSQALLVCQAPLKSGTFGTINFALEQGKDVFVIPGEIYDFGFLGSNDLLKSMQGALVTSPSDIIKQYRLEENFQEKITFELDKHAQTVVDLLETGRKHYNQLIGESKLNPIQLNIALTGLEMNGLILRLSGNVFQLAGGNK